MTHTIVIIIVATIITTLPAKSARRKKSMKRQLDDYTIWRPPPKPDVSGEGEVSNILKGLHFTFNNLIACVINFVTQRIKLHI